MLTLKTPGPSAESDSLLGSRGWVKRLRKDKFVYRLNQCVRFSLHRRKVERESFGPLEQINSTYIISNQKNDLVFEQVAS